MNQDNKVRGQGQSVQQMIEFLEAKFREKKKVKNGQIVDSTTNAKRYKYLLRVLQQFTKEKYNKAFSTYFFADGKSSVSCPLKPSDSAPLC